MIPNKRIIVHVDFDSFFASCEQQNNFKLRNKPIAVTSANGATAIIAASIEAKKMGVKSRDRSYRALEDCPSLIIVKANFWLYANISKKLLVIAKEFSPYIQVFSIDELFMDITETEKLFGGVSNLIKMFKLKIKKEIGEYITASFGISYNKLLAKLASGLNKPDGICEITSENLMDIYKKCELSDICGIGVKIKERLNKIGVYRLVDLKKISLLNLINEFGEAKGNFLYNCGLGLGDEYISILDKKTDVKSIGRQYCLSENTYDLKIVKENIFELCEEITLKLRNINKQARTIGFSLAGNEYYHSTRNMGNYFSDPNILFKVCDYYLKKWRPNMVRKISVWVSNLTDDNFVPLSFFEYDNKIRLVQKTVDRINERFGDYTIRRASLMNALKLKTVPNGFSF